MPTIDSETAAALAKILAVNAGVVLLLGILSYATSACLLDGLAALDRWLTGGNRR